MTRSCVSLRRTHRLAAVAFAGVCLITPPATADEQADQAKAQADYLEQLARQAKANAEIAAQTAAAANADANAQLALSKAQTEADKAKLDLLKASIPDFSSYKKDAPAAPNLQATADMMAAIAAKKLGKSIAAGVNEAASPVACSKSSTTGTGNDTTSNGPKTSEVVLISDPNAVNQAIDAFTSVLNNTNLGVSQLQAARKLLDKASGKPSTETWAALTPNTVLVALQFTAAISSALRPNYSFGSQNVGDTFGELLKGEVESSMTVGRLDPSAVIVNNVATSQPAKRYAALLEEIDLARKAIDDANAVIANKKNSSAAAKGDSAEVKAQKKKLADEADALAALAKVVSGIVDQAIAFGLKLNTPDAAGNSPLILAARGEAVSNMLSSRCALTLRITPVSAHADTIVRQPGPLAIFSSLRIWMNSTATARWQLFDQRGLLVKAGTAVSDARDRPVEINLYGEPNYWQGQKEAKEAGIGK